MKISPRLIPFTSIAVIHLIALFLNNTDLAFYSKPLLMPSLLIYFLLTTKASPLRLWVGVALVMSFFGDTFLMFAHFKSMYFLLGLVSFLMAHVAYIFINYKATEPGSSGFNFHWSDLIFVIFGIGFFYVLSSSLGEMFYPTMVYTAVICMMAISARQRMGNANDLSVKLVLAGACLFVMSDSILAYNKFVENIPYERILVMTTYLSAQWLIIEGYRKYIESADQD